MVGVTDGSRVGVSDAVGDSVGVADSVGSAVGRSVVVGRGVGVVVEVGRPVGTGRAVGKRVALGTLVIRDGVGGLSAALGLHTSPHDTNEMISSSPPRHSHEKRKRMRLFLD
jgi:hypothetical protein